MRDFNGFKRDYNNGFKKGQEVIASGAPAYLIETFKENAKRHIENKDKIRHFHQGLLNALTD